ncbi:MULTISPECIES: hypothetical protein [Candidatus Neomicrothrix]|nr:MULTISPECIES: hypothetical protein [Microthrix]
MERQGTWWPGCDGAADLQFGPEHVDVVDLLKMGELTFGVTEK